MLSNDSMFDSGHTATIRWPDRALDGSVVRVGHRVSNRLFEVADVRLQSGVR